MSYVRFLTFVEGYTDELLLKHVLGHILSSLPECNGIHYDFKFIWYASRKPNYTNRYIRSFTSMLDQMPPTDYLFISDINSFPCITAKKQALQNRFPALREDKIIVAIKEIESWYMAGIPSNFAEKWGIKPHILSSTDDINKEEFLEIMRSADDFKKIKSHVEIYQAIIEVFDIGIALSRNESFRYFYNKVLVLIKNLCQAANSLSNSS